MKGNEVILSIFIDCAEHFPSQIIASCHRNTINTISYLNCSQCMQIKETKLKLSLMIFGLAQGSILGPVFNICRYLISMQMNLQTLYTHHKYSTLMKKQYIVTVKFKNFFLVMKRLSAILIIFLMLICQNLIFICEKLQFRSILFFTNILKIQS